MPPVFTKTSPDLIGFNSISCGKSSKVFPRVPLKLSICGSFASSSIGRPGNGSTLGGMFTGMSCFLGSGIFVPSDFGNSFAGSRPRGFDNSFNSSSTSG